MGTRLSGGMHAAALLSRRRRALGTPNAPPPPLARDRGPVGPGYAARAGGFAMKIETKCLPRPRVSHALMDRYVATVRRHAFRMLRRLPSHVQVEDLISAGFLGLADALHRADGSDPDKFEAYATFRIRGAMVDELRTLDPLTRDLRSLKKEIVDAVSTLTIELGRAPEEIEIAQKLGLSLATFRDQLWRVSVGGIV